MFKNIIFQISSTVIAIAVVAYLILHTISGFENELEVKSVNYITMNLTFDSTAYIFRDETVLESTKNGFALFEYKNGEKVKINQKVATIYSDSSDFDNRTQIKNLEDEVKFLKSVINEVNYSTLSIPNIDKSVNERVKEISSYSFKNDLKYSIAFSEKSIYDHALKYCVLNGTEEYERMIESYEHEISKLSTSLKGSSYNVTTPCSGYFYNESDGYESIFTFDKIENISSEVFEDLKNASCDNVNSVGKIVKSSKWYIVFELKTNDAITLSPNNKYSVYFPSSEKKIDMKLEKRIDSLDDNKKILVMSSNTLLDNFNFSRKQQVSVTAETYTGLAFPSSAIHIDYDSTGASKAGVYILDETIVKFKTFNRLMEKNGYVLCSFPDSKNVSYISPTQVSLFDSVITKGTNLYHNKVIKNVLKAK